MDRIERILFWIMFGMLAGEMANRLSKRRAPHCKCEDMIHNKPIILNLTKEAIDQFPQHDPAV